MSRPGEAIVKQIVAEAQDFHAYDVGETIEGLARKLAVKPSEILKLNSNENFFVPLDFLRTVLREIAEEVDLRIYPRDERVALRESLSRYLHVSSDSIVVGTGSDALIDLVSRMTVGPGDEALSIAPTFSVYERCVKIQGARYRAIPLKEDFSLDTDEMLSSVTPDTKLLFLCSPNNPTANKFGHQEIERLAESFEGLIAVDEAYVEFSNGSVVDLVHDLGNLVVFRTFSKVFGLAGLRLGYVVTNPELANVIEKKFQMPYDVTLITLKAALKLLDNLEIVETAIKEVKAERSRLVERLRRMDGVRGFDSETNFVLLQVEKSSREVCNALLKKGVIVRDIGRILHLENCLRVTVAPPPMTDRFLDALKEVLE